MRMRGAEKASGRIEVDTGVNSKAACEVATELAPLVRRSRKGMPCDGLPVYVKNHLNLVIAQAVRYLTMSSLVPFRSLRVMEKLGDEIFGS